MLCNIRDREDIKRWDTAQDNQQSSNMNYEWKNMTKDMNDDSLLHFYNHEDEQNQKMQQTIKLRV